MKTKLVAVSSVLALLAGCSSDDQTNPGTPGNETALVTFAVSDAPVDDATEVVVAFDALELKHENGKSYFLNVVDTDEDNPYQQINLLDYQGSDSRVILSDERIPVGQYRELIIHTESNPSLQWVEANGQHDLKVPSNKLKLGGFEVTAETVQAFTIEFDLRQSLVLRGNNNNNNGYNLKPHGVKIIDNGSASSLSGNVEPALFSQGDACTADGGNFVYLYQGHDHAEGTLVDNIDPFDDDYHDDFELPEGYVAPYASVGVEEDGDYFFGFIPSGDYTVAFACGAYLDDPVQYDQIKIANPSEQVQEVTLESTKEHVVDFY
ncbi:DUF4382 domain-containing protein [Vibrio astriarenae]|uniref:DUF4382 domain-containing protein n=1 Tax=Vibrio astriarenae TaxID=1481923 RepID=UPI0037350014